ncbi:MAG: acetoacetate decarboxylase family protein [Undibacterium sp.]|uniref:acetoacetate decarboxylase family protein n=1 Tax=Undibacterium sp. TaxID=1914977 RepID=UPI00271CAD60|nr:acetoacetate decarboxylase family protein [Undibacterium sp.]MDO8654318.1 acetoacetate decarboxylase family protein [Undibacterium sp.]
MSKTAWQNDLFFQYPRTPIPTSEGTVGMPILYYDNSVMMALFRVDYDKAQALVGDQGLQAVRVFGGKALAAIAFYQYRETSIADYNEVGVAIAVVPNGTQVPMFPLLSMLNNLDKAPVGFCVVDLPVTTDAACAAGREIWGYPKFVTPIGFSLQGGRFDGAVTDPDTGKDLVRLSGKAGLGMPGPLLDLVLYSRHNGQMLRTLVNTRGGAQACLPGSMRIQVSDSKHPMAQRLNALGLSNAKPALLFHSHALQLRLNAGAVLP